jgi:prohibitin 1
MIHSSTGTKDMQIVEISLRILYRPVEQKLPEILNNLGIDYDERVIPSIGNEVLKSIVAQYNADQLLTQREKVSLEIRDILSKRA